MTPPANPPDTSSPLLARLDVRLLDADDAVAYQALRLLGLRDSPSAFAASFEEECDTPLDVVAERLAPQDDGARFGAFDGDELLGIVGVQREGLAKLAHKAFIWGMQVLPSARRQGVGRALIEQALVHAATVLGVRQVNLGVNARNRPAIALYEAMGFEAFGFERGNMLLGGELHDEIHMVHVLPSRK